MRLSENERNEISASAEEIRLCLDDIQMDVSTPHAIEYVNESMRRIERELLCIKRTLERGCEK